MFCVKKGGPWWAPVGKSEMLSIQNIIHANNSHSKGAAHVLVVMVSQTAAFPATILKESNYKRKNPNSCVRISFPRWNYPEINWYSYILNTGITRINNEIISCRLTRRTFWHTYIHVCIYILEFIKYKPICILRVIWVTFALLWYDIISHVVALYATGFTIC